ARRSLVAAGRRVRHVVLLTDGDTNRSAPDHDHLIAALAHDDVTVTTIRIGHDTVNLDLLNNISRATGGAFHHVEDVQALPQLMISDTQHLMDAAANHREAPPRLAAGGAILAGIAEDELPWVSRWAITRPKRGAEVRLWLAAGEPQDPLLAAWQYGPGRTAALPIGFPGGRAAWPPGRGRGDTGGGRGGGEGRGGGGGGGGGGDPGGGAGGGAGGRAAGGGGRTAGAGADPRGHSRAPARALKARAGARGGSGSCDGI